MIEMSKVIIFVHLYRYHHNARLYYEFVTMHGMSNMYNTKGNKLLSAWFAIIALLYGVIDLWPSEPSAYPPYLMWSVLCSYFTVTDHMTGKTDIAAFLEVACVDMKL